MLDAWPTRFIRQPGTPYRVYQEFDDTITTAPQSSIYTAIDDQGAPHAPSLGFTIGTLYALNFPDLVAPRVAVYLTASRSITSGRVATTHRIRAVAKARVYDYVP